jgi:hypothetical protein
MLQRETVAVYCKKHVEHTNALRGKNKESVVLNLVVNVKATNTQTVPVTK